MNRFYSTNNITNLLKQLPKTTGNGPFASPVKFTSLNSNIHDISTRSTSLITLPANSQVHYSGNIVAIKDYKRCEIDQDTIITENSPLNVIISTSQLACTNSMTIKGMNSMYGNNKDDDSKLHTPESMKSDNDNNWNIFNNTNIIGYTQHPSGQLQITLGYDSSIKLNKQDNVFFDKSSIVAIMGDSCNYHLVTPRLHRSLVIYNICKFVKFYWTSFKQLSFNVKMYRMIKTNVIIPFNNETKKIMDSMQINIPNSIIVKYKHNIKPILENLMNYFRDLVKLEKPSLVKITGPAVVLLKK